VSYARQTLTIFKRIFIVVGIAIAFALGLVGAIYLSLRSSETRVPDIVGKDRASAETTISDAGLNFRVRATRPTSEAKPDTVLIQLPHAGEIVKVGQTVAVDISRPSLNGESSVPNSDSNTNSNNSATNTNSNSGGNDNSNLSENANDKPKKKPTPNKNANANANANANNRPPANANANRAVTPPPGNVNAPGANANRAPRNVNNERRPAAPAPTPQGR
jgi:beta-lactam-binding protein with PASTA domain